MRPLFILALSVFALVALVGCQSLADILAATKPLIDAIGPAVTDTIINSLSMTIADAIQDASKSGGFTDEKVKVLADSISGGMRGAFDAALAAQAEGRGGWDSFVSGLTGGITGGVTGGATSVVALKRAKASD